MRAAVAAVTKTEKWDQISKDKRDTRAVFRVEEGKNRYIHEATVCAKPGCGRDRPAQPAAPAAPSGN